MLPKPGERLDLSQIHNAVHNLVLSRRRDVGFWEGTFETAWAGYVFTCHAAPNQDDRAINLIKGELLGEKRPTRFASPSEVASGYMTAAFLARVNATSVAEELLTAADSVASETTAEVDLEDRFHLYSTPEYIYAIALAHQATQRPILKPIHDALLYSLKRLHDSQYFGSTYIFALAESTRLFLDGYTTSTGREVALSLRRWRDGERVDSDSIPLVWFMENHFGGIRPTLDDGQRSGIEADFIKLRSKLLSSLGRLNLDLAWCDPSQTSEDDQDTDPMLIVSTVELLMLDEIAEKHARESFVLTKDEMDRHSLLSTAFEHYKKRVDAKLVEIGLGDELDAAYHSFSTDNEASWSAALLACRNIFYALARQLWQVPGDSYVIPGHPPLKVTDASGNERSRLTAYLHYVGVSRNKNPVFSNQYECVSSFMHSVVQHCSKGKRRVSPDEALYLLTATYDVLYQFIMLTDLQPATGSERRQSSTN